MAADLSADIMAAFGRVSSKASTEEWVRPYDNSASNPAENQFLVFLKPESTQANAGVNVEAMVRLTLDTLAREGIKINACRILGGEYLDSKNIMVQHYGVISKIYKEGRSAISAQAEAKLQADFAAELASGATVLGGDAFLQTFRQFNAFSLSVLNDNVGTKRLAGGTYLMNVKVFGKQYLVLNPFHGFQLVPYTTPGNCIIAFECTSTLSWTHLRDNVAGATDPAEAAPGSLRNQFLNNRESLGLGDVGKGTNGVHMSAGPLEGMVELQRFMNNDNLTFAHTSFGRLLAESGFTAEDIEGVASNKNVDIGGKNQSTFDGTELVNAVEAAAALKAAIGK